MATLELQQEVTVDYVIEQNRYAADNPSGVHRAETRVIQTIETLSDTSSYLYSSSEIHTVYRHNLYRQRLAKCVPDTVRQVSHITRYCSLHHQVHREDEEHGFERI